MLKALFDAVRQSATPVLVDVDDRTYSTEILHPVLLPTPKTLEVSNLSSLVEYVKSVGPSDTGGGSSDFIVHVQSPTQAVVISETSGEFEDRATFLKATESCLWKSAGMWMTPEEFIVMIQSQFIQDETTDKILKVVGNIEDAAVTRFSDDGVTQQVTASVGVVRREQVALPPRVALAPFRSFSEAEQALSPFILRMKSGKGEAPPAIALFEADGGAWKNMAMRYIKAHLIEKLPEGVVVLA
jgi:hypothetical protein